MYEAGIVLVWFSLSYRIVAYGEVPPGGCVAMTSQLVSPFLRSLFLRGLALSTVARKGGQCRPRKADGSAVNRLSHESLSSAKGFLRPVPSCRGDEINGTTEARSTEEEPPPKIKQYFTLLLVRRFREPRDHSLRPEPLCSVLHRLCVARSYRSADGWLTSSTIRFRSRAW